jgi:tRNA dimethylallyltransferase
VWQRRHAFADAPYEVSLIGLAVDPPTLDARIAARAQAMVAQGWLDEVARLAAGVSADAPAWRTLGYRELRGVVEGRTSLAQGLATTVGATRQLAKRQRTWFRREVGVAWRDPVREGSRILQDAAAFLVAKTRDAG